MNGTLTCPKCGGQMRSYEREFSERGDRDHEQKRGQKPKSKKRSFLENMMEGLGE